MVYRRTRPSLWPCMGAPRPPTPTPGQVEDLAAALVLWRRQEHRIGPGPRSRNLLAATSGCGRRIRVAKTTLAQAPILCAACQQSFDAADPDDQDL